MSGRGNMRQWDNDGARPGNLGDEDVRHKGFHKTGRGRMAANREFEEEAEEEEEEEEEMPRR